MLETTADYSQAGRPLRVTTPLGDDVLLLTGLAGHEAISQLYSFELALAAADPDRVAFDRLLGHEVTAHLELPGGRARHFSGICSSICQGMKLRDLTSFTLEIVPSCWRLTRRVQSRIFQRQDVPTILRAVLKPVPDVAFDLVGRYLEREYCVQYRESDFDFAARLLEEEGISYYFVHEADHHRMIVTDRAEFPRLDPDRLALQDGGSRVVDEQRITSWEKRQRLRAGKVTLRDHTFELPRDSLEAGATIQNSVRVGRIDHRLAAAGSEEMELYQWPGEYARRFDDVDPNGNRLNNGQLAKILPDGNRTAAIRMQQEAADALVIRGHGSYRHMASGHTFRLDEYDHAAQRVRSVHDGDYVVTSVGHRVEAALDYRSGSEPVGSYQNSFTCIPAELPFRPARATPKPVIPGPQTAVVVRGPGDDEIYTDPFGRVKVKFHWDRDGGPSPDSSCWIRVSQPSAGGGFGMVFIPRGGQEVVVHFEDGDPDRPLITGAVYNPDQMPPFDLPAGKMISGFRSNTYPKGGGLNEISVDDSGKVERMYVHAQYNKDEVVGYSRTAKVGHDATESVGNNLTESVRADKSVTITGNSLKRIDANETKNVAGNQSQTINASASRTVGASATDTVGVTSTMTTGVMQAVTTGVLSATTTGVVDLETAGVAKVLTAGLAYALNVGVAMNTIVGVSSTEQVGVTKSVTVGSQLEIKCGASRLTMDAGGKVTIEGTEFLFKASGNVQIKGAIIDLN